MSVLKNTMLAVVLALVSSACVAQDSQQWTRARYVQECEDSAKKFKVQPVEYKSVCNCAGQYVSWRGTNGVTEWADFTIVMPNELGIAAVRFCKAAYESNPDIFVKKFGTLSVSNDESQEGR